MSKNNKKTEGQRVYQRKKRLREQYISGKISKEEYIRKFKMCVSKKRYASKNEAVQKSHNLFIKNGYARSYKCPYCNKWHITVRD